LLWIREMAILVDWNSVKSEKMKNQALIVPTEFLEKAHITASELFLEIAVYLYEKKRLTLGQAKNLTGMAQIAFQKRIG
jgi:predicted HTH domain antitoxin